MQKQAPSVGRILTMVLFALSCFGLLLFLWISFGGAIPLKPKGYQFKIAFPEATQLAVESDVRISGVPVGKVKAVELSDNGLADALGHLVPTGTTVGELLGVAGLAAVLANVINNLPAVLVLLPLAAPAGPGAVLAVLVGVNIGPNLTYAGSLATLLWRRIVHQHDAEVDLAEFTRLGLLAVPAALVLAVVALWASLHTIGG